MAETNTPNYNLIKPDPLDFYDVRKFNENADLIDAELKNINDNAASHKAESVSQGGGVHGFRVETGTFTPRLSGSTANGNNTYTTQEGKYKLQGDIVTVYGRIIMSAKDANMAGEIILSGLPFVSGGFYAVSIGRIKNVSLAEGYTQFTGHTVTSGSIIRLYEVGNNIEIRNVVPNDIQNSFEIIFSLTYERV